MADEIQQPRHIGVVLPPNPSRDTRERQRPRKRPEGKGRERRDRGNGDDPPHRIDEYA